MQSTVTLTEAFELYRRNRIAFSGQSKKTEESHMVTLRSLVNYLGNVDIFSLTFIHVRDWKCQLDKSCQPSTVRGYIIKLRVVLGYLRKAGHDVLDPDCIPVPKRQDRVPSYICKEKVAAMIAVTLRTRAKAVIAVLYASGIRVSELIGLDRSDIKGSTFTIIGKGGRARLCFLDERAIELVGNYLTTRTDKHPALFLSTQSTARMTATNVQLIVNNARQKAGITEKVTPHTLRHSFATNLLANNANLFHIKEMLGHSSLQTTQMYLHVANPDLEKVYRDKHDF
jgi:site-specific recombinase XerD